MSTPKEALDVSKIFLSYIAAGGDPVKTSQISDTELEDVLALAKTECWDAKLKNSLVIRAGNPDEAKKKVLEINRAACYVQALRMRGVIDRTLQWFYESETNVERFCEEPKPGGGTKFSTKPVLDLVKAAEACHAMLYRALGDTVPKDQTGEILPGANIKNLHMTVVNHMSELPDGGSSPLPLDQIKQVAEAEQTDDPGKAFLDVSDALSDLPPAS